MLEGCEPWPPEAAERYRRSGYWGAETLASLLREVAATDGDRVALVCGSRTVSYAHLDAWADRLAGGLHRLGVRRDDRIVVQLPNVPEFAAVAVAAFRLGALPVFALPAHRRSEITYLCAHTDAVAYLTTGTVAGFDHRRLAAEVRREVPGLRHILIADDDAGEFTPLSAVHGPPVAVDVDPAEVAFFLLSGGTTGTPKLIPRTHRDYDFQIRATAAEMGFDADGVYLAALPVSHNAALGCPGLLGALRAGGRVVLASSPSPDEVFPLVTREKVTLTTLMPAYLPLWADLAGVFRADLSAVTIEVGGAPLAPAVAQRAEAALGCTITRWFGMAEGLLVFTRRDDPLEVRTGTEGLPLSAADEILVVDDEDHPVPPGASGELLTRGPTVLRGYYRAADYNARAFTSDGFLRTGDRVRLDENGRLVVLGRIKDVVNRGGEKVPPEEVEEHLLTHGQVREAAVIGIADAVLGEKTCAVVVAAGEPPTLAGLRDWLTGRGVADYKLPDRLVVVTGLPRTGVGKVDKTALVATVIDRDA
ncbi:AMP-binding protein [Micromonospora sp. NPDC049891]|uniref:(2,3-dihydroxybenzoyl)adenylate synthase n=1 Tax=Micromonospora sp. NPDC049891 TaxID=3155655 RepID=UPI0033D15B84